MFYNDDGSVCVERLANAGTYQFTRRPDAPPMERPAEHSNECKAFSQAQEIGAALMQAHIPCKTIDEVQSFIEGHSLHFNKSVAKLAPNKYHVTVTIDSRVYTALGISELACLGTIAFQMQKDAEPSNV